MTGFTKFDNQLFGKVLASDLTKRQLKILLLILRYSAGFQKSYAVLARADFEAAGVSKYCIADELAGLVAQGIIWWNMERDTMWINPHLERWAVKNVVENPGRGYDIAHKNLLHRQPSLG